MRIAAIMIARVKRANETVLHHRQNAFKRKYAEFRTLHASGVQKHLLERAMAELEAMAHPVLDVYTLHPIGWVRAHRPKTKEQAGKWISEIRRGILFPRAFVFTKQGEDLLMTGGKVGILFLE